MSSERTPEPTTPREASPGLDVVQRKLDAVLARIRMLRVSAGLARLAWQLALAVVVLYALDRWLALPLGVRAALLLLLAALFLREAWRRVARPLLRGPDRLDAARLVEREKPEFEGRVVSALQLRGGPVGSLERRVVAEAAAACDGLDLRQVLVARPSLREVWRAAAAAVVVAGLVLLAHPQLSVFASRWTLHDTRWPRDVRLLLRLPPRGPSHVLGEDGTLVAARGGVLEVDAVAQGKDPGRVDLVVEGARGERAASMTALPDAGSSEDTWRGRVTIQAGDTALLVRGGDDDGADSRLPVRVIEPPRLDAPRFTLEPPAYLGLPVSEVGPEGLSVPEGTRITLHGTPQGEASQGELRLVASAQVLPLAFDTARPPGVSAAFTANEPDTLLVSLTGAWGLQTPDPGHMALMVMKDRPPTLRVFAPTRSDVKVTARAVVPFAVIAEDDHGVAAVTLEAGDGEPIALLPDATRPAHRRVVLDLSATPVSGSLAYVLRAEDSRDLPGRGAQAAVVEGRRLDVVDDAEVQRLLADRQLRLKEAFQSIRERQQASAESVGALADAPPAADDPDLLASVVAQNQVTSRLALQARELCGILDETLTNRLDPGPGAGAVLTRRLADWSAAPADEVFSPGAWRTLAAEYAGGKFGRLDQVGRLLDMAAVALQLSEQDSPEAHRLLGEARSHPVHDTLAAAQQAQLKVVSGLDQLLQRMDEWEDYQEVLVLVKTLIDDQHGLRTRTQQVLSGIGAELMRKPLLAALAFAALTLGVQVRAPAQDETSGESAAARLQRDQARVGTRLTGLRDKMERLAQRYQEEGRTRNAQLLRDALTRFDEQKLLDVQRDVQRGLEQGSLSTVERQDALAAGLEAVYAVLRDRRDVEELEKQADLAKQALAQLGILAENQRRLLQRTRAVSDTPSDLLKQALKSAADLIAALTQTQQASQMGEQAEAALGDAQLAAQLAAQQRALAGETAPTAQTQALLQEALSLLRERLAEPTPPAEGATLAPESLAAAQSARSRAQEAAADAAQEMQAAKDALDAAARGQPAPPRPAGTEAGAASKPTQGASGSESKPSEGAANSESKPSQGASGSESKPSQGASGSESKPSESAGGAESKPGENSPSASQPSGKPQPSPGQPGAQPGTSPDKPATPRDESAAMAAARERMQAAAEQLDEVRDELDRSERSLAAARNRARAAAEAAAQEAGKTGESLDQLAQRLEASEPQSGPEMLDRTRALLEELSKLQKAAEAGQLGEAGSQAKAARESIDQLIEMLKQRQAGAAETPKQAPTPAELEKLAQEQAELQHQVEELMRRLSELPEQGFQKPAAEAAQAMQGAQGALRSGDPREGATREQEAAEKLEETQEQMSGASDRYEQLRQDEVLFRLNEDLTTLLQRQQEASADTRELDGARQGEDRLSRSQRRTAGRLAEGERDLSTQSEAMRLALHQDEALAFEHALAQTREDLVAIADKLADEQTGWNVQMLQGDVEQRLQDLLAVLDAERKRREEAMRNPEQQQGGGGGGQTQQALVPPVAELLLIQRLEQAALARLDAWSRQRPEGQEPTEVERDMLQRWAGEHQSITTLFREKFQPMQVETGGEGVDAGPPPEPPKEGPR